ncbi:NUDIX-family protein [human gut metagenome]|uniref:NUDIX-family protein n=1 Tax=human gut metagenome TaxID=408170 RepID=K1S061_9ZZZZ
MFGFLKTINYGFSNVLMKKKIFPGLWEQSGGGVISGETSLEAVKRETKEELGLDIQDEEITYIGSYTRVKDIVDIWLVQRIFSKDKNNIAR